MLPIRASLCGRAGAEGLVAGDAAAKLSPRLADRLHAMPGSGPIEVIVELQATPVATSGSRKQRIEASKAEFEQELRIVTETIAAAGGQVIETAWINQTVRSCIPAANIEQVAQDDGVAAIDLPQPLHAEGGQSQGHEPTQTNPAP
jgi:hypothetical protein